MKPAEIQELLTLKGWSRARLADELDLTEYAIRAWLVGQKGAGGPAAILMKMWLDEAREQKKLEEAATA
jgi:hypothetical protein